ncbi:hypothetical protein AVI51_13300 [Piscirickettsia salmonis]|uniref:hypothetical protein n=1 Tax=Piscirickettsia salmonis TaxID=1238 RepID=UPI0006C74C6F|nr:hypothetical protein [Piscirickettsia salmonis]APS44422.1 hypothetical protein AVI48_08630 [Piscirickettsia salmonis]APS47783.1 hypothetical protein AVI49_09240 [Piscirickettsia salmonis]APS51727.1 hypothetical protein AVI50_13420 [Piscirickettsia salmonis]APS54945.1 hypothetical protein AVI51_13300 [Piscirickettsia salmonis]
MLGDFASLDVQNTYRGSDAYVFKIAFDGYFWKVMIAIIISFPMWYMIKWLKRSEKVDVYDYNTNYNPFSIRTMKTS